MAQVIGMSAVPISYIGGFTVKGQVVIAFSVSTSTTKVKSRIDIKTSKDKNH